MTCFRSQLVVLLLSVVCAVATASTAGRQRVLLGAQVKADLGFLNAQRAQAAAAQSGKEAVVALDDLRQQAGSQRRALLINGFTNPSNLNANTLRAQAATSQAITEAVDAGGDSFATRRAGRVGSDLTFAAAQNNDDVFDATDRAVTGRKLLMPVRAAQTADKQHATTKRHLLQFGRNQLNRAANTLRSQAATAQAITEAVNNGADRFSTRNAGRVGSDLTFAAAQNNQDVFDVVEQQRG